MKQKSEIYVLDVLMKNEACHADMLEIMTALQSYLGEYFPSSRKILSGGDQLTCEREVCAAARNLWKHSSRTPSVTGEHPGTHLWGKLCRMSLREGNPHGI